MLVENDQLVHVRTTEIPTAPNEDEMNRLDEGVQVISLSFENSNNFQNNIKLYGNGGGGGEHKSVKDNQFASSNSDIASDSDSNDEEDCDSDIISNYIGHYGRWQFIWTFLLCLFQLPTTFHIFSFVFQVSSLISITCDLWVARGVTKRSMKIAHKYQFAFFHIRILSNIYCFSCILSHTQNINGFLIIILYKYFALIPHEC